MGWKRLGSSSLQLASVAIRWGVVAVCALALMMEGVSHWRVVGFWRSEPVTNGVKNDALVYQWQNRCTFEDGRLSIVPALDLQPSVTKSDWGLLFEPLSYRWPWFRTGKAELSADLLEFYGFHYALHGDRIYSRIPLYMIWLPTLPIAIWVIVRHIRWRKARRVKGFEPILPDPQK